MDSPRFQDIPLSQKYAFFYDFLVVDLKSRVPDQVEVFNSPPFNGLPKAQQARLLRLTANCYLSEDGQWETVKRFQRSSWKRAPLDPKTNFVFFYLCWVPKITRSVVQSWQVARRKGDQVSPFELAIVSNKQTG